MEEKVKQVDISEQLQKQEIFFFAKMLKKAVIMDNNQVTCQMEEWTKQHVRQPLNEKKNFRTEVENIPMVDFVEQTAEIIDLVKRMSANKVDEFQVRPNRDCAEGELVVENYLGRNNNLQTLRAESEPIVHRGVCYSLRFSQPS